MINFILWLVVGAIIGWAASSLMGTRNRLLLNIVVGIVGAFLAGFLLTPYLGISTINQNDFSLLALMVSLLGAIILLTVLSFFSRRTASGPSVQPQPAVGNFCRQCGTANPTDAQFCKNCGVNLGLRSDSATG